MLKPKEKRALKELAKQSKEGQYGIEILTKIQFFKAETIEESMQLAEKIKQGKKFSLFMLLRFVNNAIDLGSILSNYDSVANEYQDLSENEKDALNKIFEEAFNIDNDKAEELGERTNQISHDIADYFMFLFSMKK